MYVYIHAHTVTRSFALQSTILQIIARDIGYQQVISTESPIDEQSESPIDE